MDRRVLTAAVVLALGAGLAWWLGYLGPKAGGVEEGPIADGDAPSLLDTRGEPAESGTQGGPAKRGGTKSVAKTKSPSVDAPRITGHVTDRVGKPIAGAHVISIPNSTKRFFSAADLGGLTCPAADTLTDAGGSFVVVVSQDAPMHAIVVEAASYGTAMEESVRAGADVTIVLDKAAAIFGTVTDPEGAPVVGAHVRVIGNLDTYRVKFDAVAALGGAYRIEDVPATTFHSAVEVTADGFAPLLTTGVGGLEPGEPKRRDFILIRGAVVSGTVVDAETAAPIEGAHVVIWSSEGGSEDGSVQRTGSGYIGNAVGPRAVGETVSAKDGTFRMDHIPAQGFHDVLTLNQFGARGPTIGQVAAWKAGYSVASSEVPFLRDRGHAETSLKLLPAAVVEGRVVLANGQPLPAVAVYTDRKEGGQWLPASLYPDGPTSFVGDVGPDGRYRLTGVPVSRAGPTEVKLTARLKSQDPFETWNEAGDGSVSVKAKAGETVQAPDLVLRAGDLASGAPIEIVDPAGRPVWGATVGSTEKWVESRVARTDASGRVTIPTSARPGSPPTLTMTARAKGWALTSFTVIPGSTELVRVTLKPAHRLKGRVLLSDRAPAAFTSLQLADASQPASKVFPAPSADGEAEPRLRFISPGEPGRRADPIAYASTDDQGNFLFEDLPEGPYHLLAERVNKGTSPSSIAFSRAILANVATDTSYVEIVLPDDAQRTGYVEGTVIDASTGRPVPGLSVALRRGEDVGGYATQQTGMLSYWSPTAGTITSPGRYEIPNAFVGIWALEAEAEGYRPRTVQGISVRAGETTVVPAISLDHGTTVRGRITVAEGFTMADRRVGFQDQGAGTGRDRELFAEVSGDGTFTLAGFTPGVWKVSSQWQGYSAKPEPPLLPMGDKRLEIHEGESDVRFDMKLVPGGSISIQPTDDRLPPARGTGGTESNAQRQFGEACKLTVIDASGAVVAEQKGVRRYDAGELAWLLLLPGHYVVRFEMPGGETREEAADVIAGGEVQVRLVKK